jgi:hypothetical protein
MIVRRQWCALRHLFVIAFITTAIVIAHAPARAADAIAQLAKLRGDVEVTRAGVAQPATAGMALALHDTIKTGAQARAQIRFADGSAVTLGENATLAIDHFLFNSADGSRNVALSVLDGAVSALVTKSSQGNFDYEIKTAQGYSAARGTNWIVAVQNQTTRMLVITGLVEVGGKLGNRVVCEAGETVTIDAARGLGEPSDAAQDLLQQYQDATAFP